MDLRPQHLKNPNLGPPIDIQHGELRTEFNKVGGVGYPEGVV